MKNVVLGTAGHIDHGKTTLVKALTGIDTDRLKEERERGITIDIGFAHLELPGGARVGIVDVPGHERFVRNMLAGAGGIDLVMLVVAADEGVMPQTREHFEICRLLGIERGLVALTKVDMVEPDWLDLVREDLEDYLHGSFLEGAPVIPVSGVTGAGLPELKAAIAEVVAEVGERPASGIFRLPIDRVFSVRGFGTVVTGTVVAGRAALSDQVIIQPHDLKARVRGIEVHGEAAEVAVPGRRTALNLQGIERAALTRGDMVTGSPLLAAAAFLDVRLTVLAGAERAVRHRSSHHLHVWASESLAQVALPAGAELRPGASSLAQLRLETPVTVLPGDRFVLRELSPAVTVGGGVVLGISPGPMRRRDPAWLATLAAIESDEPLAAGRAVLARAGLAGLAPAALQLRVIGGDRMPDLAARLVAEGSAAAFSEADGLLVESGRLEELLAAILAGLDEFHRREPLRLGNSREEIRSRLGREMDARVFARVIEDMVRAGRIESAGGLVSRPGYRPALTSEEQALADKILAAFEAGEFKPPLPAEVLARLPSRAEALLRYLIETGRLVKIHETIVFPSARYQAIAGGLKAALADQGWVDVGVFKDLFGLTRKYAVPLLEHFDAIGLTRRQGDRRLLR